MNVFEREGRIVKDCQILEKKGDASDTEEKEDVQYHVPELVEKREVIPIPGIG